MRLILSAVCLALLICATRVSHCGAPSPEPEALRSGALDDLFVLRDYRPGKTCPPVGTQRTFHGRLLENSVKVPGA
jgi:hypothetical protein